MELPDHLERLATDLDRAWVRQYGRHQANTASWRCSRFVFAFALVAIVLGAGAAIAAGVLKTVAEEERGLLEGHLLFSDSKPTCVQLTTTAFRCTLEQPPTGMTFYEAVAPSEAKKPNPSKLKPVYDKFLGVKVQTVDASDHVDGGCVSISADGRTWNCYLGESAVARDIIGPGLLGQYQPQAASG